MWLGDDFPAAVWIHARGTPGLLGSATDGDVVLEFTAVPPRAAGSRARRGDRAVSITLFPHDDLSRMCRSGPDLGGFVQALLLFVKVIQQLEGDGGKGEPFEGIAIGEVETVATIGPSVRAYDMSSPYIALAWHDNGSAFAIMPGGGLSPLRLFDDDDFPFFSLPLFGSLLVPLFFAVLGRFNRPSTLLGMARLGSEQEDEQQ